MITQTTNIEENIDETLEAVWESLEDDSDHLENIKKICKIPITDELLDLISQRNLLNIDNDRVIFTEQGKKRAENIIRRHRITDVLLYHVLGYKDHDRREEVACETEHTLQPEVVESICTLLGHPTNSPDGKKIPPGKCCVSDRILANSIIVKLSSLKPEEKGRVEYIKPKSHSRYQKLESFGLIPGVTIKMVLTSPSFIINFENTELALDKAACDDIYVTKMESTKEDKPIEEKSNKGSLFSRFSTWFSKGK